MARQDSSPVSIEKGIKARGDKAGAEKLLKDEEPVIFAADQRSFSVEGERHAINHFSVLFPLVTEKGRRFTDVDALFPNRGRVWWLIEPGAIDTKTVVPGSLWTAPLETSRDHGGTRPEKDWYQVDFRNVKAGARGYCEVLDVDDDHPDPVQILDRGLRLDRVPSGKVLVRGRRSLVGPVLPVPVLPVPVPAAAAAAPGATTATAASRVTFQAMSVAQPWTWRIDREAIDELGLVSEFEYTANRHDKRTTVQALRVVLFPEKHLKDLEEQGTRIDAATERQVLNWALDMLGMTRADQSTLKRVLERAQKIDLQTAEREFPGRFERFLKLCGDRERVLELSIEAAEAIGRQDGFRELLDSHKEQLVAQRVDEEVHRQSIEIESRIEAARKALLEQEKEFAQRQSEFDSRWQAMQKERIQGLDAREAALARREAALDEKERVIRDRLDRVIQTYRSGADSIWEGLLTYLPLLGRAGLLAGAAAVPRIDGAGGAGDGDGAAPAPLALPAFLARKREASGIDESGFLRQLEHVVQRRGFRFDYEDLVNVHVCVKTGAWTVLAGASGLGKSSLPRLYAEALGGADEYLHVAVRPDWLDDRDVIGAYNALSRRYEPAACGLVDRLIAAHEDLKSGRGGIYVICLDEMNLSRVEHYFAQFLSALELAADHRSIHIMGRGTADPRDPYAPYATLPLGDNVRFIGTVNIDETSHFFSPRLVDRTPIVAFGTTALRHGLEKPPDQWVLPGLEPVTFDRFRAWSAPVADASAAGAGGGPVLELVLALDECLRAHGLRVSFRVRDRVMRYVSSARGLLRDDRAMDLAILQNVLPHVRPTVARFPRLVERLRDLLPAARFRRCHEILEAMNRPDGENDFFQLI
jgi:hypothetical protein